MEFINTTHEEFSFTHLGSRMHVGPQGVTLSDENRELLLTALRDKRLEVVPEGRALAQNILASFDQSIGGTKPKASEIPPRDAVVFHNETDHPVFIVACGSRHEVPADGTVALSGTNDELLAAAMDMRELKVVNKAKVPASAKVALEQKKKEDKVARDAAKKSPAAPRLPKENISKEEAVSQAESLHTVTGSNPNRPSLHNESKVSEDLASELEKSIKENEPGSEPAGGLRVV